MKKVVQFLIIGLFIYSFIGLLIPAPVYAQECDASNISSLNLDALSRINDKCNEALASMEKAVQPHIDELRKMDAAIAAFQARIKVIEFDVAKKATAIAQGEKELAGFLGVAGRRIRQFYIRSFTTNPMALLLSSVNIGSVLRTIGYQQAAVNEDKKTITQTALSVKDLEDKKKALENERASLAVLKADTDRRATAVRKLVGDAQAYEDKLRGVISTITSQQQAILNGRSGTFTTSVGDVPLADDPNASPNFNPGFSPAFGGFSFGAYTHRKGMSQYGAKGRANSGQSAEQIILAYYPGANLNKSYNEPSSITVIGYGSKSFEDEYLIGIYEMPSSFPMEALKAQAVAARTYAIRQGGTICATDSCQVFKPAGGRNDNWVAAVRATRGWVLEGGPSAQYSSTTGGYSSTSGWDTKCGNQGCWTGDAYEKIASSPWFYKGWYTSNYYNDSAKCGRSHPWLTNDEFADILNAWQVRKNGGDASRILPVTINSCSINGATGNPFSIDEMRSEAGNHGGAFTSVSSVSVSYNGGGYTDTVHLMTNKGSIDIPGSEFKETFNLRAPGYISIRSVLYNIEKK